MYIQKKKFFSVSNSFKLILGSLLQSAPKTNSRCEDKHFSRIIQNRIALFRIN